MIMLMKTMVMMLLMLMMMITLATPVPALCLQSLRSAKLKFIKNSEKKIAVNLVCP